MLSTNYKNITQNPITPMQQCSYWKLFEELGLVKKQLQDYSSIVDLDGHSSPTGSQSVPSLDIDGMMYHILCCLAALASGLKNQNDQKSCEISRTQIFASALRQEASLIELISFEHDTEESRSNNNSTVLRPSKHSSASLLNEGLLKNYSETSGIIQPALTTDISQMAIKIAKNWFPLYWALILPDNSKISFSKFVIEAADEASIKQDSNRYLNGYNLFHILVQQENADEEILQALVLQYPDMIDKANDDGLSPVQLAIQCGHNSSSSVVTHLCRPLRSSDSILPRLLGCSRRIRGTSSESGPFLTILEYLGNEQLLAISLTTWGMRNITHWGHWCIDSDAQDFLLQEDVRRQILAVTGTQFDNFVFCNVWNDVGDCQPLLELIGKHVCSAATLGRFGGALDIHCLSHLKTVELQYFYEISDISALSNVEHLMLESCPNITDVSALGRVKHLEIVHCVGIEDISALGTVHHLLLAQCSGISDYSMLGNVKHLELDECRNLRDISALGTVHHLEIIDCPEITDVSALGNVHHLVLADCIGISDVSALGKVHRLELIECHEVTDVSALGNVHHLVFNRCEGISDVSALGKVHHLEFDNCHEISDVSALGNVHHLAFTECEGISDVSALGTVRHLKFDHCHNITDVSALGNVHELILVLCSGISDVSALGNVHHLQLAECGDITDVSALGNVQHLELIGCQEVSDVSALGRVPHLRLRECDNIVDVSGLASVEKLELFDCQGIKDVSALSEVKKLTIVGCDHKITKWGNVKPS